MSSLFGGGSTGQAPQNLDVFRIMNSSAGAVIPIIYGTQRISPTFIWVGDFKIKSPSAGKKFSPTGKGAAASYTYSMSVAMALCEGLSFGLLRTWGLSNIANVALTPHQTALMWFFHNGDPYQGVWTHLTSEGYPAIAFRNLSYVSQVNWQLGNSAQPPQTSFEVRAINSGLTETLPGYLESGLDLVLQDLFTSQVYGCGIDPNLLGGVRYGHDPDINSFGLFFFKFRELSTWINVSQLYISPILDNPRPAADWINELCEVVNGELIFQNEAFYVVPYTNVSMTGLSSDPLFPSVTYSPNMTPVRTFTDQDYISKKGKPPVTIVRKIPTDRYNEVRVRYRSRYKNYDNVLEVAKLQSTIDLFQLRPYQDLNYPHICNPVVAAKVARMRLFRLNFAASSYTFTVAPVHIDIDPMDIVAINDPSLPVNLPVRVKKMDEDKDGNLTIECEDIFPGTWMGVAPSAPNLTDTGVNAGTGPGNVNTPCIFEPGADITGGKQIICVGLSGQPIGVWGGCGVWLSIDGGTSYQRIGTNIGANAQGPLLATLASHIDPDTTNTLKVDESASGGVLTTISTALADLYQNLAYIDNGLGTGEFISFANVTALANGEYDETYLHRGLYGSTPASHAAGTQFVFCGSVANPAVGIFSYAVPTSPNLVGTVLYFKFTSFNIYGQQEQDLSAVTAYAYTMTGNGA